MGKRANMHPDTSAAMMRAGVGCLMHNAATQRLLSRRDSERLNLGCRREVIQRRFQSAG
jgi:hypothetical protein